LTTNHQRENIKVSEDTKKGETMDKNNNDASEKEEDRLSEKSIIKANKKAIRQLRLQGIELLTA